MREIVLSGRYCSDLAERFSYTELKNWRVQPDIAEAAEELKAAGDGELYVVTCFSDRDKLLNLVKKEEG